MKCIRCGKEFDEYTPYRNAECYGGFVLYACPHCGKMYSFMRTVVVKVAEGCSCRKEDDWGHKVISDEEYYKTHKKD